MIDIDLEALPDYVFVKNPKGLVVEVPKARLPKLLEEGYKLLSGNEAVIKQEEPPRIKSTRVYLNVEEI